MVLRCSYCKKENEVSGKKRIIDKGEKDVILHNIVRCNKCKIILGQYDNNWVFIPWYGAKLERKLKKS